MKSGKPFVLGFSLASLCAFTIWANMMNFAPQDPTWDRFPASIAKEMVQNTRAVEESLIRQVASLTERKTASIARQPDMIEQVRFEVLQGKYSLILENERIKKAEFVDNPSSEGYPALIEDRLAFLEKYGEVLANEKNPGPAHLASLQVLGQKTIETYSLKSHEVRFVLDSLNRVLEMSVEPIVSAQNDLKNSD